MIEYNKKKKKKQDKILMLAKSKLNSIETLITQALIDIEISHEEFITILNKKDKYEKMKQHLRSGNGEYKIMRLSNVKSKTTVMTTVIKRCRGEKTRGIRAIDGFRKKVMIPDSEILKCPEFEVKSKIRKNL